MDNQAMRASVRLWRRDINGGVEIWNIEDYLPYVVAHEVDSLHWPIEALKAQTVAARTYAYYHTLYPKHPAMRADLCTETCCQRFRVKADVPVPALTAVAQTAGQILHGPYNEIVETEYHACCGGVIPNCPCNCKRYGHGRGMCQQGAKELAIVGASYEEILDFYYPGTHLVQAEEEVTVDTNAATEFLLETCPTAEYHPTFALAKAAREARLGLPITSEHIKMFQGVELVYQWFQGGLAWCVKGKWNDVHVIRL